MIRLQLLGPLCVSAADRDPGLVLRQPKRAALLAYLAAAGPHGYHRRDVLLALFWPELDAPHARDALNSAFYFLRNGLGPRAVVSRGVDEVGIAADRVWTDVVAFEAALAQGQYEEALELYRGDFLEGFHLSEAAGFEQWMEGERRRLREAAAHGARALADRQAAAGHLGLAAHSARRALALAPDDEPTLRRLLELLDAAGDHAGALRVYQKFAARLEKEFGAEPATATRSVIARIRRSSRPTAAGEAAAGPAGQGTETSIGGPPAAVDYRGRGRWRRMRWVSVAPAGVLGGAFVGGMALLVWYLARGPQLDPRRIAVAAFDNVCEDTSLAWLGQMVAEQLSGRLVNLEFVQPVALGGPDHASSGGSGNGSVSGAGRVRALARSVRAGTVIRGAYYAQGDSLRFTAEIVDVNTGVLRHVTDVVAVPRAEVASGVAMMQQAVLQGVATLFDPRLAASANARAPGLMPRRR